MTLKELRANAGLRQVDVSKKLRTTIIAVSNWELGKNGISRKYHKKLAKLYGVPLDTIEEAVRSTMELMKNEVKE